MQVTDIGPATFVIAKKPVEVPVPWISRTKPRIIGLRVGGSMGELVGGKVMSELSRASVFDVTRSSHLGGERVKN